MELKHYSTETLLNYIKEDRGIEIKQNPKDIKLKPYFKEVNGSYSEPVSKWEGHYGMSTDGTITLCTPKGKRILDGYLFKIHSDGTILRIMKPRIDTSIKVNKDRKVVIQ